MKKKVLPIILATLILSTLTPFGGNISAESIEDLKKEINKHEEEKSRISEDKSSIDAERDNTESQIDENLNKQDSVVEKIMDLEAELAATQKEVSEKEAEIISTNEEIDELTNQIEQLEKEIEELEEKIEKRDVLLRDRLRSIQQGGGQVRYIEVIFGAQNFSDFISRASAVNTIMDQDRQIMEEQAADKELLADNKVELEDNKETVVAKKEALEDQKDELLALETQLDDQRDERETLLAQLEEEHLDLEEIKLTLEEEQEILEAEEKAKAQAIAQAQGKIGELEQLAREEEERKRKEEERRKAEEARKREQARQAEQEKQEKERKQSKEQQTEKKVASAPQTNIESESTSSSGNGLFITPANGRISSHFGMRHHPIYKINRPHNGIDFAVGTGTPLRAPADGVVSTAGWKGGFGNVIMISHYIDGQSYTTVSAHLSSINVSPGQSVSQGQVIGATGNTGDSTGPHLHFEVHVGNYGNPVNPLPYLK